MIDYEKLKQAHELAKKYEDKVKGNVSISVEFENEEGNPIYELKHYELRPEFKIITNIKNSYWDVDDLIAKLKELIKPEPKYEDGQEVWMMYLPVYANTLQPGKFKIDARKYTDGVHQYCSYGNGVGLTWREENTIYASKEELIQAQVDYWLSLSDKSTTEILCNKIGDDAEKRFNEVASDSNGIKCKHCGGFYK